MQEWEKIAKAARESIKTHEQKQIVQRYLKALQMYIEHLIAETYKED